MGILKSELQHSGVKSINDVMRWWGDDLGNSLLNEMEKGTG